MSRLFILASCSMYKQDVFSNLISYSYECEAFLGFLPVLKVGVQILGFHRQSLLIVEEKLHRKKNGYSTR